jgi:hypothetical protein
MKRILMAFFMMMVPVLIFAATTWVDRNNFISSGDLNAGDIIVVNVMDISSYRFEVAVKTGESGSIDTGPDMTITGFLPKVSGHRNVKGNESTQFNGRGRINFSIATQVQNRQPNGKLAIAGNRVYAFNGVANTLTVTGIVDPALVRGRSVDSSNVASLRIQIQGSREGLNLPVPRLGPNDKAGYNLTEQQKQELIIRYIQKLINEQTR